MVSSSTSVDSERYLRLSTRVTALPGTTATYCVHQPSARESVVLPAAHTSLALSTGADPLAGQDHEDYHQKYPHRLPNDR